MVCPQDNRKPLPAKELCNSWGKPNPVLGKGALGNSSHQKMYHQGDNAKSLVCIVQTMLTELGYDIGSAGINRIFGTDTENAVKAFQEKNTDWNGNSLNVDGLVGPETSDAMNRAMVGLEGWFDFH